MDMELHSLYKRIGLLLLGIFFCLMQGWAGNALTFEAGNAVFAGIQMPYRFARTATGGGKPALVIYLHGGSSKGNDNEMQMKEAGIDSIANYLVAAQVNALFLVPQCPADKSWGGPMLGVLKSLIERYVDEGIVDGDHVYLFGGSMGGTGTWSMLSAYPRLFAAAMPVAGNPSKCVADSVALTPVFTVMGTADRIMSVETAADFITELTAKGGEARMETEEGWTHEMTCIQSYTTPRLDWVFAHRRFPTGIVATELSASPADQVRFYSPDGCRLPSKPAKGLYIKRRRSREGAVTTVKRMW